jgi:hypothetical protein
LSIEIGTDMVSKKQHYLPQFYLKQWANDRNQVWAYYKNREPIQIKVRRIGCENHLYSINKNDYLEQWLAQIDGDLSTVIDEVKNSSSINENITLKLKAFLVILMARNPKSKSNSTLIMNAIAKDAVTENPFAQILRFRTQVLASEIEPLNVEVIHVHKDTKFSFVTSNQPFFVVGTPQNNFAVNPSTNDSVQHVSMKFCWMPLTPKILVFFTSNQVHDQIVIGDRIDNLININKNLTLGADQYLVSDSASLFDHQPELRDLFLMPKQF